VPLFKGSIDIKKAEVKGREPRGFHADTRALLRRSRLFRWLRRQQVAIPRSKGKLVPDFLNRDQRNPLDIPLVMICGSDVHTKNSFG